MFRNAGGVLQDFNTTVICLSNLLLSTASFSGIVPSFSVLATLPLRDKDDQKSKRREQNRACPTPECCLRMWYEMFPVRFSAPLGVKCWTAVGTCSAQVLSPHISTVVWLPPSRYTLLLQRLLTRMLLFSNTALKTASAEHDMLKKALQSPASTSS